MAKFAVIKTGGKQYLVKAGDTLKVEKLVAVADKPVEFNEVLLVAEADGSKLEIGQPKLATKVSAQLTQQGRAKKVLVVHYKAKIRYHKKYGHRQPFSEVKIDKIA